MSAQDVPRTDDPESPRPPASDPSRRSTAPQSPFTTRQVAIGGGVLVVGLLVTVGLPLLVA